MAARCKMLFLQGWAHVASPCTSLHAQIQSALNWTPGQFMHHPRHTQPRLPPGSQPLALLPLRARMAPLKTRFSTVIASHLLTLTIFFTSLEVRVRLHDGCIPSITARTTTVPGPRYKMKRLMQGLLTGCPGWQNILPGSVESSCFTASTLT